MEKIDTNSEMYTDLAKEGVPGPHAALYRAIVEKLNEIVDWINNQ